MLVSWSARKARRHFRMSCDKLYIEKLQSKFMTIRIDGNKKYISRMGFRKKLERSFTEKTEVQREANWGSFMF